MAAHEVNGVTVASSPALAMRNCMSSAMFDFRGSRAYDGFRIEIVTCAPVDICRKPFPSRSRIPALFSDWIPGSVSVLWLIGAGARTVAASTIVLHGVQGAQLVGAQGVLKLFCSPWVIAVLGSTSR